MIRLFWKGFSLKATQSPKSGSRAPTTVRPLSPPQSIKSHGTNKTRPTDKGTSYPPLPESRFGEESMYDGPSSPTRSRVARSKAPSVSPSDSLSQVHTKRHQSTTKSPSHREGSNVNQSERGGNGADFSPRSSARQMPVNGNGTVCF